MSSCDLFELTDSFRIVSAGVPVQPGAIDSVVGFLAAFTAGFEFTIFAENGLTRWLPAGGAGIFHDHAFADGSSAVRFCWFRFHLFNCKRPDGLRQMILGDVFIDLDSGVERTLFAARIMAPDREGKCFEGIRCFFDHFSKFPSTSFRFLISRSSIFSIDVSPVGAVFWTVSGQVLF